MEGWSTENVFNVLHKELVDLAKFAKNNEEEIDDDLRENLEFLRRMISQAPSSNSGPLLPKTPKVNRKNAVPRIETIHEDESVEFEVTRTASIAPESILKHNDNDDNMSNRRSTRTASKKAANSIKQQQSLTLQTKLRRPSNEQEDITRKNIKDATSSSDEENYRPIRQSRKRKPSIQKKKIALPSEVQNGTYILETEKQIDVTVSKERVSTSKRKRDETRSPSPQQSIDERSSKTASGEPIAKRANVIDETIEKSNNDDTLESSIYEDAIGRPAPIHNSTKIIDTTLTLDPKSRESKKLSNTKSKEIANNDNNSNNMKMNVTVTLETASKRTKNYCAPEQEKMDDEDIVDCTPDVKSNMQNGHQPKGRVIKNSRKPNALFSPYGADSVRKRVEAFEQAGLKTPTSIDVDAPTRVTRTKTRAMAAAEASGDTTQIVQNVQSIAQKLARKSLAKAKKISLAKYFKDTDDSKENEHGSMKPNKLLAANEKHMQKMQLRITPVSKSRLQQPMSINRLQHTPLSVQPLSSHSKAMSASRGNIVVGMDSFIQSTKHTQKLSLTEKIEEKKRKANEEDARRKRDEALKARTEEKKRKREEKELKNKLAREAKEKLDMEKRLKAEKEREEKALIALQIQEKHREEAERKRLLQMQRAMEKEERRRQEEQLRLQKLQEQEEMERQLAEQKRKEQEAAERQHQRRLAEAKAQQQASAEAAKLKSQYPAKNQPAKYLNNTHTLPKQVHVPTSYKIESEPDEDDEASDTEDAPKHPVPSWAQAQNRKEQLALQMFIPSYEVHRYFDSRQCTPDLTKIFEDIDKRRLKRTSSAIWKTPPRYSMMYNE